MHTPAEVAVLAANQGFYTAFRKGDAAALGRVFARHHLVACTHPGWEVLHGRDAVLASFRAIFSSEVPDVQAGDEVAMLYGDVAVVTCVEHAGGSRLVATNVFVFEEGAWRMVHHHASGTAGIRLSAGTASPLN